MKLKMNGMRLAPLPTGKTAVDVFGDFLSYLFHCTRSFIIDTHANGAALWRAVEHDIQFVLSHPNGWEGAQQAKMRRAAVYGGLIPDTDEGRARIRFVTEGEASLHACVLNGLAADVLSVSAGEVFGLSRWDCGVALMWDRILPDMGSSLPTRAEGRWISVRMLFAARRLLLLRKLLLPIVSRLSLFARLIPAMLRRVNRRVCWVRFREPEGAGVPCR